MNTDYPPEDVVVPARVNAWAPASLSNLGPGFDCLGMAIDAWGDGVEASPNEHGVVRISFHEDSPWIGPTDPEMNTAGVAARAVVDLLGVNAGVDLVIRKGIVPGSGVGSSAASAAAAAWAVSLLFGSGVSKEELVEAVLAGECVASGSRHGDNVLPALFGGLLVVSAEDPSTYRRIESPGSPAISVLLPDVQILTKEARNVLPDAVSLKTAAANASSLALLVSALHAGEWADVGRFMMTDRIVEPSRIRLIPEFSSIRDAALQSGAFGCTLSGSGPAVFAISESDDMAEAVLEAMRTASLAHGREAHGMVTHMETGGVRQVPSLR